MANVTMKQIAELAQVSLGTVSHVVNGTAATRDGVRRRVLEAIRTLGYQPSQLARGLRRKSTDMLGMLIPDITNPFFPAVVRGVEDVAFNSSFRLVLCNTDDDPAKEKIHLDELRSFRPAGLLVIPAVGSNFAAGWESSSPESSPIICVDRCPADWRGDAVLVDNHTGAFNAGRYLMKMGHKRIAVIAGPTQLTTAIERLNGFSKALLQGGLKLQPECIQVGGFDRNSGHRCAIRLLEMVPRPTAIFASNDLIALGALLAVKELGLRCPQDVSIVGFDNLEFSMFTDPPLTSISQSGYQLGATAARLIIERIRGQTGQPQRVLLDTELKIRNSVAPYSTPQRVREAPSKLARGRKRETSARG
jgi:LacI family transcriptional regulator